MRFGCLFRKDFGLKRYTSISRLFTLYILVTLLLSFFSVALAPTSIAQELVKPSTTTDNTVKNVVETTPKTTTTTTQPKTETTTTEPKTETTTTTTEPKTETTTTTTEPKTETTSTTSTSNQNQSENETTSSTEIEQINIESDNTSSDSTNKNSTFLIIEQNSSTNNETQNDNDASEQINSITLESTIRSITEDEEITIETPDQEKTKTTIQKVEFTASSTKQHVKLSVTNYKESPKEITNELNISDDALVYEYLDVKLTADDEYIGETGIESMKFTFCVKKSWINNNSIDMNSVQMMHYHNDSWDLLNTTLMNETEDCIYYQAETSSLSIFAVVGDKVVEDSSSIVDGSVPFPSWVPVGFIAFSSSFLGVILVKKRYIYKK